MTRAAVLAALLLGTAIAGSAHAQVPNRASSFNTLGANKEPINIESNRIDVFDKESRAVFEGDVVAVQGDTTVNCTTMSVLYEPRSAEGEDKAPAQAGPSGNSIRQIDCKGPVTVTSKTQVITSDHATFDRSGSKVILTGNVGVGDGPNVTRGEHMVYDLATGTAAMTPKKGSRVKALFVPGEGGAQPANPPRQARP